MRILTHKWLLLVRRVLESTVVNRHFWASETAQWVAELQGKPGAWAPASEPMKTWKKINLTKLSSDLHAYVHTHMPCTCTHTRTHNNDNKYFKTLFKGCFRI